MRNTAVHPIVECERDIVFDYKHNKRIIYLSKQPASRERTIELEGESRPFLIRLINMGKMRSGAGTILNAAFQEMEKVDGTTAIL